MGKNFAHKMIHQSIYFLSFLKTKNDFLAFLGWPYYILERLIIYYALFIFLEFLFPLIKKLLTHTQYIHKSTGCCITQFTKQSPSITNSTKLSNYTFDHRTNIS